MADAVRYNAGKPQLSYWLSTQAYYVEETDADELPIFQAHLGRVPQLEAALAHFCAGELSALSLIALFKHRVGDDEVGEFYTQACEYGAKKYSRGGFRGGFSVSSLCDSAARHLKALRTLGETYEETYTVDGESFTVTLNHWAGACWNIVMIYEMMILAPERDDRLFHFGNYRPAVPPHETTVPGFFQAVATAERLAAEDGDYDHTPEYFDTDRNAHGDDPRRC